MIAKSIRAAVYTRKSVDKGTDGEFGSIDAQREAGEAHIASRRGQGWVLLPERYDDLGVSGSTLRRPGLERLLADIDAGHVDAVVVYKFDRLSRSLADFTRTVQKLEQRGVAVVSVTQAVDTSTSTGKLMVNLLASFAQFERETTAERVRDKLLASRRRGLWTGGNPPLGYDLVEKKLVVNEHEAEQVREIFAAYLHHRSLAAAAEALNARGFTTKRWTNKRGRPLGGARLTKSIVRGMVTSPWPIGKVRAGNEIVEGEHDAIVDDATWQAAQALLAQNQTPRRHLGRSVTGALLQGLLKCGVCGSAMGPHRSHKRERTYGYYVCQRAQKRGADACPGSRVSMGEIDRYVVEQLTALGKDAELQAQVVGSAADVRRARLAELRTTEAGARADVSRLEADLACVAELGAQAHTRAHVVDALARAQARLERVQAEAEALRGAKLDGEALRVALGSFLPVWDELFHAERRRVLGLLLERITFNASAGELTLHYSEAGVDLLADEAREAAA